MPSRWLSGLFRHLILKLEILKQVQDDFVKKTGYFSDNLVILFFKNYLRTGVYTSMITALSRITSVSVAS